MVLENEKRRGGRGKKPADVPTESLRQTLERYVEEDLVELQQGDNRERAREIFFEVWDPRRSQSFIQAAVACKRMEDYHHMIQRARDRGRVYPWIYTPAAAASFESIYVAIVVFWLGVTPPDDPDELARAVRDFVALEVGLFAAAIGPPL